MTHNTALILIIFLVKNTLGYDIPSAINLGITNILDGGPKVESPGFYVEPYVINYYSNKLTDHCGNNLENSPSPRINLFNTFTEFSYQSRYKIAGGSPGCSLIPLPIQFSYTSCNQLAMNAQDAGIGNPQISLFFQWDMISHKNRPLFIHRLGGYLILPYGTNGLPQKNINPADILTALDAYWAASLYFTEHFAASWRLHYLVSSKNKKTHIKPGACFHMNYSVEYEAHTNCWIAINGYYLQQLHNNTKHTIAIAHSKERTFSVGPGVLIDLPNNYQVLGHLYWEKMAQNRPQGITAVFNVIKLF